MKLRELLGSVMPTQGNSVNSYIFSCKWMFVCSALYSLALLITRGGFRALILGLSIKYWKLKLHQLKPLTWWTCEFRHHRLSFSLFLSFSCSSQVTLGKVLKVIVVMRSLFIDRTIVKGYSENVYTEDGKVGCCISGNRKLYFYLVLQWQRTGIPSQVCWRHKTVKRLCGFFAECSGLSLSCFAWIFHTHISDF